jgi:hypothetical protein
MFNLKVLLGGIIFALGVFAVFMVVLWSARARGSSPPPATAILNVIEVPTNTPIAPRASPTPPETPGPTQQTQVPGGDISIGEYVQVSGTGGDGLRLHKAAGVGSEVNYVAIDSEVFKVQDGPTEVDGYVWWQLQDPYSENATGWGVSNYLVVVPNP